MKSLTYLILPLVLFNLSKCFTWAFSPALVRPSRPFFNHLASSQQDDDAFAESALAVASATASLRGKVCVVKYGGNAMTSQDLKVKFCEDVAALQNVGIKVVVVHGGGPQISSMLEKVGVETRFEGGMRVSSKEVVDVAEMVLCGSVNKEISSAICAAGGRAIGISGRDDSLLQCTKQANKDGFDLGFVGKVETVNTDFLHQLLDAGLCPVVSPIGTGIGDEKNIAYNVNADVAAGRIAGELGAARVLFLTDIAGVLDKEMNLIKTLTVEQIEQLIDDETITGGMIPKVRRFFAWNPRFSPCSNFGLFVKFLTRFCCQICFIYVRMLLSIHSCSGNCFLGDENVGIICDKRCSTWSRRCFHHRRKGSTCFSEASSWRI